MKKVINGKLYDTEKAKKVGSWDNGHFIIDHEYCAETLYQKRTGEFFLHGEGGAMSKYGTCRGGNSGLGETIIPMSYDDAQEWAEDNLDGGDYIKIFGNPEEAEEKQIISASITKATYQALKKLAADKSKPIGEIIDNLLSGK